MRSYKHGVPTGETQQSGWSDDFLDTIRPRMHGANLLALMQPKPGVAETAADFAGDHMPTDALEVARIAHIAELAHHLHLGRNIRRSLHETFGESLDAIPSEEWHDSEHHLQLKYNFGLIRDFPLIAEFTKAHEDKCKNAGHEFVDIEGLVDLVERVNFESIIIKSALDYSNFRLLDDKDYLTEQESAKMRRIITAIKTVDSPLLALTGFDAFESELLSKAYCRELENGNNSYFVHKADTIFSELGGRHALAKSAEQFIEDLFENDKYSHSRVTDEQERYELFFTDGSVSFGDTDSEYRVLARLKSVGATAKKVHALYNKSEMLETPMDIVGFTLIAEDETSMVRCLEGLMQRLAAASITYQAAPSRTEQVHVKGSQKFLGLFGSEGEHSGLFRNMAVKDELCDNGYEAVKLTMSYNTGGKKIPVEVQVTHEAARASSRSGLGAHTLFKLTKLAKDAGDATLNDFSKTELLERLQRISARKSKFDKSSYETNGESTTRANGLYKDVRSRTQTLGRIASND